MTALRSIDQRRWERSLAELTSLSDTSPLGLDDLASAASELLSTFTRAAATVYRPVRQAGGFGIGFLGHRGLSPRFVDDFRALLPTTPKNLFVFDPTRPDARERNVVRYLAPRTLTTHASAQQTILHRAGMGMVAQTRMLVCSGPVLLGWVGIFRESSPIDAARDSWLVRSLGRALRRPLRLLHGLPMVGPRLFEAMLEMLPGEAYLVTRVGRVETANRRGVLRLASRLDAKTQGFATVVSQHLHGHVSPQVEVHPLRGRRGDLYIVHRPPPAAPPSLVERVEEARRRWTLTGQQVATLRALGEGQTNKEIAEHLSISVRTVEAHVRALTQRAGVDSRLRLVAALWSSGS